MKHVNVLIEQAVQLIEHDLPVGGKVVINMPDSMFVGLEAEILKVYDKGYVIKVEDGVELVARDGEVALIK